MSTVPGGDDLPRARRRTTLWPGLVWAVPLAALIIVGYLGIQALTQRGEMVTVTFNRAAGAQPGDTKVLYQGAEAGVLVKILPNKDGRRIDFKLRLVPEAKPGLNSNARFWLIGATPSFSDLSSLKAVVEGVAIGYAPGEGGTPTDEFTGLESAPTVLPGDKGTRYQLNATRLGTVQVGSAVLFHGFSIGKVSGVDFRGQQGFRLEIFVFEPYDSLIKKDSQFWTAAPVRLSFTGGSIDANLAPASTILTGGIDVETPEAGAAMSQSPPDSEFLLYASREAALEGLSGTAFRYDFAFDAAAGDIEEGAPVTLLGFQVGEVESARLAFHENNGQPYTQVTALLYPRHFNLTPPADRGSPLSQAGSDAEINKLLHLGYRARLRQTPALVGATSIALVPTKGLPSASLIYDGRNPRIPSAPGSSDLEDITSQADQLLAKLNRVPIEAIGEDLRRTTDRLQKLANSPELDAGLKHLSGTLKEVDQTLADVQPKVAPLLEKLNQAADELNGTATAARQLLESRGGTQDSNLPAAIGQLNEAARSIRELADYLDRHPESLLRGKRP